MILSSFSEEQLFSFFSLDLFFVLFFWSLISFVVEMISAESKFSCKCCLAGNRAEACPYPTFTRDARAFWDGIKV